MRLISIKRLGGLMGLAVGFVLIAPTASGQKPTDTAGPSQPPRAGGASSVSQSGSNGRLFVVTLAGLTVEDLQSAASSLEFFRRDLSVAGVAMKTAGSRTAESSYASLGAGNRATGTDGGGSSVYPRDAEVGNGQTAIQAINQIATRDKSESDLGEVVVIAMPSLTRVQDELYHGAKPGSLGSELRADGFVTAIVSAATLDNRNSSSNAALAIADHRGMIDRGKVTGLTRFNSSKPLGITVDSSSFLKAVNEAAAFSDVIFIEPGELERAAIVGKRSVESRTAVARLDALTTSFDLTERIAISLKPQDELWVLGVFSPQGPQVGIGSDPPVVDLEFLREEPRLGVLIVLGGDGSSDGFISSPSTRRAGLVTLTDLGPSVLERFGVEKPQWMSGRAFKASRRQAVGGFSEQLAAFSSRNAEATHREDIFLIVIYTFVVLNVLLALLAFWIFASSHPVWLRNLAHIIALAILAAPLAGLAVRLGNAKVLGVWGGQIAFWLVALLVAGFCATRMRMRHRAGIAVLLAFVGFQILDLITGSNLQANSIFGNSDFVAGRFYGLGNTSFGLLGGAALIGLGGLARFENNRQSVPWFYPAGLGVVVIVIGAPVWGSDVGGVLASCIAFALAWLLATGRRIRKMTLILVSAIGSVAIVGMAALDYARPENSRTHLGRFFESVVSGELEYVQTTLERKFAQSFGTLLITRWAWAIPVAVFVGALLLRPKGPLSGALASKRVLFASLWGCVILCVVGFAVNDSGIVIPAMIVSQAIPFMILLALDQVYPRRSTSPQGTKPSE